MPAMVAKPLSWFQPDPTQPRKTLDPQEVLMLHDSLMKILAESLARFRVSVTQRRRSKARVIVIDFDQGMDSEAADS